MLFANPNVCNYSEAAFFPDEEGRREHCQHIAHRDQYLHDKEKRRRNVKIMSRRKKEALRFFD